MIVMESRLPDAACSFPSHRDGVNMLRNKQNEAKDNEYYQAMVVPLYKPPLSRKY